MSFKKMQDPWVTDYENIIKKLNITNHKNKLNTYRIIGINHRLQKSSIVAKTFLKSTGWIISTGIIGATDDETASKLEQVTKLLSERYTKKYNQDWNSILSNIDHVPIFIGGYETINNPQLYSYVNENFLTTAGFYSTLLFSTGNIIFNGYRILNRDDKARQAYGFVGIILQTLAYKDDVIKYNVMQSKKNGGSILYSCAQTAINDLKKDIEGSVKLLYNAYSKINNTKK